MAKTRHQAPARPSAPVRKAPAAPPPVQTQQARLEQRTQQFEARRQEALTGTNPTTRIRVKAIDVGYYRDARRRVGDVFDIEARHFSARWMVRAPTARIKVTGSTEALRLEHERIKAMKDKDAEAADPTEDAPTGARNPLDDE
jgi:hypothetical protein